MKFLLLVLCLGVQVTFAIEPPVKAGLIVHLNSLDQSSLRKSADLAPLGNGNPLDRWLDSTTNSFRATQPWALGRPVFRADDSEAFARFDGKDDFLFIEGKHRRLREVTVFILAAPRGNVGGFAGMFAATAVGKNDYTSGINIDQGPEPSKDLSVLSLESAGSVGFHNFIQSGKNLPSPLPFESFHVFTVRSAIGPKGNGVFIDGILLGEQPRNESSIGLDEMIVGGRIYSNDDGVPTHAQGSFHGDIAAVLVYDRALTDDERVQVEQSLFSRTPGLNALASGRSGHALETLSDAPVVQMLVPGFTVEELPIALRNQNNLRYRHDGKLVALGYDGRIQLVTDTDGDGREDHATMFWDKSSLRGPMGMALLPKNDPRGEGVFVASKGKVSLILDKDRDGIGDEEILVATGWKEIPQGVDAVGIAVDRRDGSVYFGLGTANYANGYLIEASTGRAEFDLASDRGTIQKVSPDFKKREIVCTGVRFTCALAFNREGDLFASEQEGATWLPNGNALDELLHIVPGRHYGFPPRHPKHLPQVIDEPAAFEYGPQHQSTVGMVFNEGVNGGPAFGPAQWRGDALVCGESRGKLYRTKLVKTPEGYVAQNQIIACLGLLAVDTCVTPQGDLLIACHSGPPDWGTGPAGAGRIFRLRYTGRTVPQPVHAWAAAQDEFRIAFDRPLQDADWAGTREKTRIETGRYASAGDRFEVIRPGYQIVRDQMGSPRRWVEVQALSLSVDRRTIVLRIPRQTELATYAVTLPLPTSWQTHQGIPQRQEMDIAVSLHGVQATLENSGQSLRIVLPHASFVVSREITSGSGDHEDFFRQCDNAADSRTLTFRGQMNLANIFVPVVQPRATLDWNLAADPFAQRTMILHQDFSVAIPRQVAFAPHATNSIMPMELALTGKLALKGSGLTFALDSRARPIGLTRFLVPWASSGTDKQNPNATLTRTDVKGNWLHGRRVFFGDGGCATCHTLRGEGIAFGPDLSNLLHRDRDSVLQDITKPSATINPDQTGSRIRFKDGTELNGVIRRLTEEQVTIQLPAGAETQRARREVASIEPLLGSLMPEGLGQLLNATQMEDLLTFLLTNPLEPAAITRLNPVMPPARTRKEIEDFVAPSIAVPSSLKPLHILLCIDNQDHGVDEHDYPVWQKRWAKLLSLADKVTVSTAQGFPTREQLARADVTLFYSRNSGWNPQAATLLDEYQTRGGGLVYLHWAMEGGKDPAQAEALAARIGLSTGRSKYRHGKIELNFTQPTHPITQGFKSLSLTDETYWAFYGDPARISALATAVEEGSVCTQLWTFQNHKGRVFGSIPGHYTWTFDDPLYRVIVLRGIAWTAHEKDVNRLTELALIGARFAP